MITPLVGDIRPPPPLDQIAGQLAELTHSAALSIYERRGDEAIYDLAGAVGWESAPNPPTACFDLRDSLKGGRWRGFTSYVAWSARSLRLDSVNEKRSVPVDGKEILLERDGASCELARPGAFLGVPLKIAGEMVGVIRAVRRAGELPFSDAEERLLQSHVARVTPLLQQTRRFAKLITSLFEIATIADEDEMLDRIAAVATELVHGHESQSAIFIRVGESADYAFRAPRAASGSMEKRVYRADEEGLTPLVISKQEYLLSLDLERDLSTGFLQHVRHTSKSGELREGKTRSFVAVRIPDLSPRGGVLGVIRMSSEQVNAFAYQDVEMLRALARQLGVLFDRRQRLDEERRRAQEKQSLFATLIDTSAQPVVAVDSVGRIRVFNRAAREVLGLPVRDDDLPPADRVIGGSVVQLAYGDNRVIAGAVRHAIEAAARGNERLRDYHTVLYRRSRDRSHQLIPVPVRLSASYLLDQETGQPIGSIGIFEDLRASSSIDSICRIQQTCDEYGVTVDPSIAKAIRIITDLPPSSTEPVLITAETGSGKELLVDAIHFRSGRRGEPHKLNCAEVREDMVELFGSVKGAYTGAENLRGIFEEADGGTVFLDEISELSLTAQAKLLIVIGKGRVQPLGATKPRQVDVRVICATNKDLAQLVAQGRFREDLYFRIRGYTFTLPPLRERNPDIMLLADHFLAQERKHLQVNGPLAFASDVVRAFLRYSWPGNVRELQHAVNVAVALWGTNQRDARDRTIRLDHLPLPIREAGSGVQDEAAMRDQVKHLENQVAALEQDLRMARAAPVPAVNNGPGPSSSTQVEPAATTRGRHDVIRGIVLRDRELLRTLLDEKSTRGVNKKVIDQCGENKWTVSRVLKDLRSTYKRMDNVLVNSTSLGGSIRGDQPTTEWILGKLYPRTGRGADKSWVSAAMPALLEHWQRERSVRGNDPRDA